MKLKHPFIFLVLFILIFEGFGLSNNILIGVDPHLGGGQSGETGAVKGLVKKADTGELVPDAKVLLVNAKYASIKYETKTDKEGYFYKGGLRPGQYNFTVEKEGYLPNSRTVRVRLADTVEADFELQTTDSLVPEATKSARRGLKSFREGKWEEAVKEFSDGIAEDASNALLFFYRGMSQENNGNTTEALLDYQKAIELKPDFLLPYSRSGKIYAQLQNYEKAHEFYSQSVELGDQDITTLYNYSVVLINLGKSPEAKPVLEKMLELDDAYADAYYHLGIVTIGAGDAVRAKELLQKFIELDPENPNAPIAKQIIETLK